MTRTHSLLCAALAPFLGVSAQAATLYNVDIARDRGGVTFNASNDDSDLVYNTASPGGTSEMTWNVFNIGNVAPFVTTVSLTDLFDSTGGTSTLDVSITQVQIDGYSNDNPRDGVWTGWGATDANNGSGPTITLSGFNPGDEVDLTIYHGNARWGGTRASAFTFDGQTEAASESVASDPMPLTEGVTYVQFSGLTADANGEIVGTFGVPVGETGTALISGMQINVVPEPGSIALLGLGGLFIARRRRH